LINLTSKDSYLFFKMDNKIKNISCEIENEDNNKYKVICISESRYIFDLSNNNYIAIKDLQKSLKMTFDNGGNSVISNSTVEINPFTTEKKSSSGGLSGGAIVAIVLSIVALIAIITVLLFVIRHIQIF